MVRESKLRGDEVSKLNYPTASLMRHTSATGTMDKLIPIVSSGLVNFRGKKKVVCTGNAQHIPFQNWGIRVCWVIVHTVVIGAKCKIKI